MGSAMAARLSDSYQPQPVFAQSKVEFGADMLQGQVDWRWMHIP